MLTIFVRGRNERGKNKKTVRSKIRAFATKTARAKMYPIAVMLAWNGSKI